MSSIEAKEVDFVVLKEDYSRFVLAGDGTILRSKEVVKKIFFHPQTTPEGYPKSYGVDSVNITSALVPSSLKRQPSSEPWDPDRDMGEEMRFDEQKAGIQEYMTHDGFRVTLRPVLTKVFKYQKFNNFGEPIYSVQMQTITNVEKTTNAA